MRYASITRRHCLDLGLGVALGFSFLAPGAAAAQDFRWTGRVAAGHTIEIKGVLGNIRAVAASGDEVEVVTEKSARRSDPDEVEVVVLEHAGGVTICAVYPTPRDKRPNECAPGNGGRMNTERNDVNVDFTVRVPRGVRFSGRTVNGGVEANGLQSDLSVAAVNGDIDVSTTGIAEAHTVNGSISARLGRVDWTGGLEFETVNGGITIELPVDLATDVRAGTVNGDISTDFPLRVEGLFNHRRIRGTIGGGGRDLSLVTVNGSIRIRKSS